MEELVRALDALPKVDLHCHIEGTMRPATVVDLARKNRIPLPTSDPSELPVARRVPGRLLAGPVDLDRPRRLGAAGL